ncbi:Radical SAM domain protein [Labilithrix luteola]|uniref:Radical SAM domain protein n=1 Tax=Labilithrix luteola TaxID=1391654 RepID=A0A0K1Q3E6_9BACT|nr:cobalamin-dependent protein [Labilithrix luteola]AKV00371.1 Radical SAM domain protein [Labilithrix luteola]
MTHVALVGPEIEENLSLRYIASSLAARGHTSDIVAFNGPTDFGPAIARIMETNPAVVGISLAFQWRASDFFAFAVALREAGFRGHVTAGGHFGTFAAREILTDFPEFDSICVQEAEETFATLTDHVGTGRALEGIAGLWLRDAGGTAYSTGHPALPDLATLPWPDRRGEPAACFGHGIAPLVSSRGCYAKCSFCCIAAWHEQSLPGKRYRLRDVDDVAAEMVEMQRTRGIDIFVFHDDNFFVPGHRKNIDRFNALADALERRGIGDFATVVKARPTDVTPAVFEVLKKRLRAIRCYIGIETDADQGLSTLQRWAQSKQNHRAIEVARSLDLYACFNMLLFDPDTTVESIETNLAFMRFAPEFPSNFGRVELYAGTPLLARMAAEGRCRGDYLSWDYTLGDARAERVFQLSMRCFDERNFGVDALANRIMGTRFDIEVFRHFHPDLFRQEWAEEGKALSRAMTLSGADSLERIVRFVKDGGSASAEEALVAEETTKLRAAEDAVRGNARDLARTLLATVKRGKPLTWIGDRVATPLQKAREVA